MKIRKSFVSNSSSSSFTISDKEYFQPVIDLLRIHDLDYLMIDGKLHTSFIYKRGEEQTPEYYDIEAIAEDEIEGDYDKPWNPECYNKKLGALGNAYVYWRKDED
jgi:hypothetical protein